MKGLIYGKERFSLKCRKGVSSSVVNFLVILDELHLAVVCLSYQFLTDV